MSTSTSTSTYNERIQYARHIIEMVAKDHQRPIIYSGLGKDSIGIVHLANSMGLHWPIMFHRDPFMTHRYDFANKIISDWKLTAYDYPHYRTSFFHNDFGTFEVVRHYQIGTKDMTMLGCLCEPDDYSKPDEYLCAFNDLYNAPHYSQYNSFNYCWDAALSGWRTVETKPHFDGLNCPFNFDVRQIQGSIDFYAPLRTWSDEDIYQYHIDNQIPINHKCYDVIDGKLMPKKDKTYNPDFRPACWKCMVPGDFDYASVDCPKKHCRVSNVSNMIVHNEMPWDFVNRIAYIKQQYARQAAEGLTEQTKIDRDKYLG